MRPRTKLVMSVIGSASTQTSICPQIALLLDYDASNGLAEQPSSEGYADARNVGRVEGWGARWRAPISCLPRRALWSAAAADAQRCVHVRSARFLRAVLSRPECT